MAVESVHEQVGPDYGPLASAALAIALAVVSAIGAASMTAITLAATFEMVVILPSPFEQYRLIDACSRFAAEVSALIVLILSYRNGRGRPLWPRRLSLLGLMKGVAFLGLIASRFLVHFSVWMA